MELNKEPPRIMHIDLNSAFATTEQQAHPSLRGRPVGITNRLSRECCVITASYEAKARGVKVGMRRSEAMSLCPDMVLLETDPPKYHTMYQGLLRIMREYSPNVTMKSIDEGVLDFHGCEPVMKGRSMEDIGYEIKQRVKEDLGEWMRINVGIGPNRFLAKQAAGWHKPDGLDSLDHRNLRRYYAQRQLTDLSGIAFRNEARLNSYGIRTPLQFLEASEYLLKKSVFHSINGTLWYRRLRGFETDNFETHLGMVGRQWVVHEPTKNTEKLGSCLNFLCETTAVKLRFRGCEARGLCVWVGYQNGEGWHAKKTYHTPCFTNQEIMRRANALFNQRPHGTVKIIGVYCYGLASSAYSQCSLFEDAKKEEWLTRAVDEVNETYGEFTVFLADSAEGRKIVKQKIPFGGTQYFDLLLKTR